MKSVHKLRRAHSPFLLKQPRDDDNDNEIILMMIMYDDYNDHIYFDLFFSLGMYQQ